MKSIIKHITHPYPDALLQARIDHAHITGTELVERPWWYEDIESGKLYHDIFGCIGWPSEVSDKDTGLPGYIGIVGIVRPLELAIETHYNPQDAVFRLMAEGESDDVPTLLDMVLEMRQLYGFGVQPNLLTGWFGDPERFITTLALKNERLIVHGEDKAILIAPPDDFYTPNIFDNYVRSIRSCMIPGKIRFYFGTGHEIFKNRLREFKRDDPAVLSMGGLIHSLLNRVMWMDRVKGSTIFNVEEGY